jgi:nitroreductase
MPASLPLDETLTTTRAVRKRLDVTRPVPRAVIEECLDLALQAPNGSNRNTWRWIIVDEPAMVEKLAAEYNAIFAENQQPGRRAPIGIPREDRLMESAMSLGDKLAAMPAILVPLMPGRPEGKSAMEQAVMWGSIVQAVWSFMLALRSRGLGSVWTTVALQREREIARLLGVPFGDYAQVGLFPIAYTIGTDFKRAWRKPLAEVLSYNGF